MSDPVSTRQWRSAVPVSVDTKGGLLARLGEGCAPRLGSRQVHRQVLGLGEGGILDLNPADSLAQ